MKRHIGDWESQLASRSAAFCNSKTDLKACFFYDLRKWTRILPIINFVLIYALVALGQKLMNNYEQYGFVTPDGVCASYAARTACNINSTVDPACLGSVDKCKSSTSFMPIYGSLIHLVLHSRHLEG